MNQHLRTPLTPSPALPARGRVQVGDSHQSSPHTLPPTSPLAGEAGRGVSPTHHPLKTEF
jgi:hypothetical protein